MNRLIGKYWVCCGAAGLLAAAEGAFAQAAPAPPVPAATGGLEEIVVTAQKRSENLQKVPISIAAVTAAKLDNLHATSLLALAGSVPDIQINEFANSPNTAVFNIRGIGVADADPYAGTSVSVVVDGVPQYFSVGALLDLFDVDRIEILRGPQGTLFGANTTGGVVNVVTAQPTGEFGGKAEATYGNYHRFDFKAAIDFPIVNDLLAGKIAYIHSQRDGFFTNLYNGGNLGGRNLNAVRGYLKFTPASNFKATVIGEYSYDNDGAPVVVNVSAPDEVIRAPEGTPGQQTDLCLPAGQPCHAGSQYVSADNSVPNSSKFRNYRGTLTMDWTGTAIGDITAITGYRYFNLGEYTDQDGTILFLDDTYRHTKGHQISQEVRSSFKLSSQIHGIIGGFYLGDHYYETQDFRAQFALPGFSQYSTQNQTNHSLSAFTQLYYDITDQLTLLGGFRYTHEYTRMIAGSENCLDPSGIASFGCHYPIGGFVANGSKSWNNAGWKLGANYQLTPSTLFYAYWARGFKSGGFVGRVGIPQDIGPFAPEHIDTFEGGAKSDFFDHKLRLNVAGFYSNYSNIQVAQQYFLDGGAQQGNTIVNAAKATIKGFEFEGSVLPTKGLTLTGALAYLDAKYKTFNFFNAVTGSYIDLSGKPLQNAPKWTASAGANYSTELGTLGKITANIQYNYTASKYLSDLLDTPRSDIQPTSIFNGNIDYTPHDGPLTLSVWAKNLFDKRYIQSVLDIPGTVALLSYDNPREFGVTARVKF